jgi:hypothetical protein
MKRKNLWALLIAIGLLIVSAVLAFCKMPESTPVRASVPAQNIDSADASSNLEPIADESVPFAASQPVLDGESDVWHPADVPAEEEFSSPEAPDLGAEV